MTIPTCLVVDDDPAIIELSQYAIQKMGIQCLTADAIEPAKTMLKYHHINLCLVDMQLPYFKNDKQKEQEGGLKVIEYVREHHPHTLIAVITGHGDVQNAVKALQKGAFDYLNKGCDLDELRNLVSNLVDTTLDIRPNKDFDQTLELVGQSQAIVELRQKIRDLARVQTPVYIYGESGVGKEVVATLIHKLSARRNKPFIPVNCGAISPNLVESEFFGYVKGSFTGAYRDTKGLFQAAEGGTLFLDEISELPLSMQVKLLRVIQEKKIRLVGATEEMTINVRIISASNHHLQTLVKQGKFRKDLYFRLNVFELYIPPLRERFEDLKLLSDYLLMKIYVRNDLSNTLIPKLSDKTIATLKTHPFYGNVRELENILESTITFCRTTMIEPQDLMLSDWEQTQEKSISEKEETEKTEETANTETKKLDVQYLKGKLDREGIVCALIKFGANQTRAAEALDITRSALRYRIDKYEINVAEIREGIRRLKD